MATDLALSPTDALEEGLNIVRDSGVVRNTVGFVQEVLDFRGKTIVNVGSGNCWEAPFYLEAGAKSVTCIDKHVDLNSRQIRNHHSEGNYDALEMPMSVAEYFDMQPGIEFVRKSVEDHKPEQLYDVAILLTVSEHLTNPKAAIEAIARLVKPGGVLFLTHGNFYAWAGHHLAPYSIASYNPEDPGQAELVDWGHVVGRDSFSSDTIELNFIRLHELADLLTPHFKPTLVRADQCPPEIRERMTPERRLELAGYYDTELFTDIWTFIGERTDPAQKNAAEAIPAVVSVKVAADAYREGHCYITTVPSYVDASGWRLFEDGIEMPFADQKHSDIREKGAGRYSIWGRSLYFAPGQNDSPADHSYELRRRR